MTISGCGLFRNNLVEPLCLEARPLLQDVTIADQRLMKEASEQGFEIVVLNDRALKDWIVGTEKIVEAHNEQFKATCAEAEEDL
jgi:hypothetical protein